MNAPATVTLTDEQFRASVVGGSEVAALFDASPWLTKFELWHRKNGTIATPDFNAVHDGEPENERVYFGVKLEPLIIEAACERWGYVPLAQPERLDNGRGLGGHPDKIVSCSERGKGLLEAKAADWLVAKSWGDEPPLHYLLQIQTYMGLAGCSWGDVIVLVGGNELRRFRYDFRPKLFGEIVVRVVEFWRSVRAGKPPKPDYTRDGEVLAETIGRPNDTLADLRHSNRAAILAAEFLDAKRREKDARRDAEAARAELLHMIGTAGSALLEGYRIGCAQTRDSAGTLITPDMVGQHVGGRRGYRRFDVKELN